MKGYQAFEESEQTKNPVKTGLEKWFSKPALRNCPQNKGSIVMYVWKMLQTTSSESYCIDYQSKSPGK